MGTIKYRQREESRIASAYLVHCREIEMFSNIKKRLKRIEKENEAIENRMENLKVHAIKRAYEKKTAAKITQEFMLNIKSALKKKMKILNAADDELILQRYSQLSEENVTKCVQLAFDILIDLDVPYSTFEIIHQTARLLLRKAITVCICFYFAVVTHFSYLTTAFESRCRLSKCHRDQSKNNSHLRRRVKP